MSQREHVILFSENETMPNNAKVDDDDEKR